MANTYVDYTATAGQTDFAFNFPYLEDDHVTVEINGVAQLSSAFTIVTTPALKVVLNSGVTAGQNVRVRRKSQPNTNLVDFVNGSVLTESELDRAYLHNRYLAEEISELNDASLQEEQGGTNWDAKNKRIKNVGTPTATTDASTKDYVDNKVNQVSSGATQPPLKWQFTGLSGANTTYTVTGAEVNGDTVYDVSIDGLVKEPTADYTVDPDTDTLTIVTTLSGGEDIVVIQRGFGVAVAGIVGTDLLVDGSVTTTKIQDAAVTTAKIQDAAVTTAKIQDAAVTTAKISGASNLNITATDSTTARSLADRFADVVNVKDYGATGDGVTDDTSAIQAAEAAGDSVYFPEGNYNVTVAPTLNKSWGEGTVSISSTQTYLHPQPGPVSEIFASVFSPNNTATTDASTELQRAIDFAQDNDLPLTLEEGASYRVFTGLTFKHGQSATDAQKYSVKLNGNNAKFFPDGSAITVISVVPRCTLADRSTGRGVSEISIKDLTFSGYASTSSKALVIGETGYACDNFLFSKLENILIQQFNSNAVLFFKETRHYSCKKVVIRNSTCRIEASTTSSFCGDMVFHACEFVSNPTGSKNPLDISSAGTGAVRGIHFDQCYFYGNQTELVCNGQAGSQVGDIWFVGCQFDQGSTGRAVYIASQNSGQIFKINIISCYFVAYGANTIYVSGASEIGQILINNSTFSLIDGGSAIFCLDVDNVQISNNTFKNLTNANQCINIDACQQVSITDNVAWNSSTVSYGVAIGNASDRYFITDNMFEATLGTINDYSTGTPLKTVNNNLLT